jgi:hypothetical protein
MYIILGQNTHELILSILHLVCLTEGISLNTGGDTERKKVTETEQWEEEQSGLNLPAIKKQTLRAHQSCSFKTIYHQQFGMI